MTVYDNKAPDSDGLPRKPDGSIDTKAYMEAYQKKLDPIKKRLRWYHSRDKTRGWDTLLSTIEKYPDPKSSEKIMEALHQKGMEAEKDPDLEKKIYKVLWLFGNSDALYNEYSRSVDKKKDLTPPVDTEDES